MSVCLFVSVCVYLCTGFSYLCGDQNLKFTILVRVNSPWSGLGGSFDRRETASKLLWMVQYERALGDSGNEEHPRNLCSALFMVSEFLTYF